MNKAYGSMSPLGPRVCGALACSVAGLTMILAAQADAEIHRFTLDQTGARNLGIWRLTNDPAIRDEGNYHNIQCWSCDGRYTCHTHWGGDKSSGGKAAAEVHVVDLMTGEDRRVDRGINPRWANSHNWLFYCHWTGDGTPPYETGTQIIRYDAGSGEKVVITHGMEGPGSLDATDTWLYGVQRYRGRMPEMVTVRVRNRPGSIIEAIQGAPNMHGYVHVNPRHPVIMTRAKDLTDELYGRNRALFDLDGSNLRTGSVMCQAGHQSWSGDGQYLLIGNGQVCGRPWDKPFPSDLDVLSWGSVGDICPCGKSGRYICGGNLTFVDTRSGDAWPVVFPYSNIVYPMAGDHSTLMDIDSKGSPDGTKIHYHSTRDIENSPIARVTKYELKEPDVVHVDSTDGFPESGEMVCFCEVVGYRKKTATTFEGLTRCKYGTRPAPDMVRKVRVIFPLPAFVLSEQDKTKTHAEPDASMVRAGIAEGNPLLYQRQTDCYVVVTRLPSPPHLRLRDERVELIPGESHWETRGYRVLCDGRPVTEGLCQAGSTFVVQRPGAYTAIAVEWSGLESPPSLPLDIRTRTEGRVLKDKPDDFAWTWPVWQIEGKTVSRADAMIAPHATIKTEHLHDGEIAREAWEKGQRICRVDLNEQGKPIRRQEFQNGELKKRTYTTPEGFLASQEFYGPDGFKTEYVRYYTREDRRGTESSRWWYERGRPVKMTKRGQIVFDTARR
jgi:hypothetical protein